MFKTKELHCSAINCEARDIDWSEQHIGEDWDFLEAQECGGCSKVMYSSNPYCEECHSDVDFSGPMMNYWYPLPQLRMDAEEAALELICLPLCLVSFPKEDDWGLALTGGGMDLTWEICSAYVKLGFIPPMRFWSPPRMAGYELTPSRKRVLAAIREGIRWQKRQVGHALLQLKDLSDYMKKNRAERLAREFAICPRDEALPQVKK